MVDGRNYLYESHGEVIRDYHLILRENSTNVHTILRATFLVFYVAE